MSKVIIQKVVIKNATPKEIYEGLLDSKLHCKFTGGKAEVSNKVGGAFTAWDGYITGKNIELKKDEKIVQEWKASDWHKGTPASKLTLTFKKVSTGTEINLKQENVPKECFEDLTKGWIEFYWKPMQKYFNEKVD